ncbi:MAG: hypothetical protein HOB20_17675 [Planctomycetaceae bacterium]|jgi:cell shape-determining protein MreD|nr:hypothetical protein [Planctomycetaceae bacterium]
MAKQHSPSALNLYGKLLCYLILLILLYVVIRYLLIRFAGEEGVVWLDDVAPTVLISILCFIALRFPMTNSYQQRQQGDSCQE